MHYSFQMNSIVLCLILSTELLVSYFSMSIFYSFLFCTLTFFLFFVPGWLLFPPPLLFLPKHYLYFQNALPQHYW